MEDVYLYGTDAAGEAGAITPIREDVQWCLDSMRPLSGDFTVPSDRGRLVDPILGLWATVLQSHLAGEPHCELVYNLIREHHAEVFPREYFGGLITLLEEPRAELTAMFTLRLLHEKGVLDLPHLKEALAHFALDALRYFAKYNSEPLRPYIIFQTYAFNTYASLVLLLLLLLLWL